MRYSITYEYDVPWYTVFSVEADTPEAALAKAEQLFEDGAFSPVIGKEDIEGLHNERVYLNGVPLSDEEAPDVADLLESVDK